MYNTQITATKGDLHRATVELRQVSGTKENSWHLTSGDGGRGLGWGGGNCEGGGRIPVGEVGPGGYRQHKTEGLNGHRSLLRIVQHSN